MTSPAQDIAQFINDNTSLVLGTDLFAFELGEPDFQFCIIDQEGFESFVPQSYLSPGVQIIARGRKNGSIPEVYNKFREVHTLLLSQDDIAVNGNVYNGGLYQEGDLGFIGRDDDGRPLYSANYFTYKTSDVT